ncbi:hypothetical protein B0H14DRAFT_2646144 [Mycena olivaceomarginata]|nr:hypothetical protein B0H14DRAFT_2646144 [Mycena olivaceomarginata]
MGSVALFYGTILWGAAVALMLSGIVPVHCIIFFKLYPDELSLKTAMVATVWLDAAQSAFILALFHYFVVHFGNTSAGTATLSRGVSIHPIHLSVNPPLIIITRLRSVAVRLRTTPSRISQVLIPGKAHNPGDFFDLLETEGSTQRRSAAVRACTHFYEILG